MFGLGRLYVVAFKAVAITVQQDLFYIKPAADKPISIEKFKVGVVGGNVDAGDAQEELFDIQVLYVPATVTASSGGSSYTPAPMLANDSAAGFTARINDTTKATSSGTIADRDAGTWLSRTEWEFLPIPEHRPLCANAAAIVCRLNTTPNDSVLCSGVALVRELL